jgi:hypothetical protein
MDEQQAAAGFEGNLSAKLIRGEKTSETYDLNRPTLRQRLNLLLRQLRDQGEK